MAQFEQYWTMEQIAERVHASVPSVKRWIGNGSLKKTKASGKTLISESALQDFLRESTERATSAA